jgi:hypothetical protein
LYRKNQKVIKGGRINEKVVGRTVKILNIGLGSLTNMPQIKSDFCELAEEVFSEGK